MGFQNIAPELATLFGIEKNTRDTVNAILGLDLGKGAGVPDKPSPFDELGKYIIGDEVDDQIGKVSPFDEFGKYKKSFATGGYVGQTGMHQLHAGEFVINRSANNVSPTADADLTARELKQIRQELGDIKEQNRQYYQDDLKVGRGIESGVTQTAEQQRRMSSG